MGRASHRVLWHAVAWLEVARYEINVLSGRGDRHNRRMQPFQAREIRAHILDCGFAFIDRKVDIIHFQ